LSIVFLGTSEFAAAVLERLASGESHRPALVITRPDRPRGRGQRLASPPVAERARALDIPLEQPRSVNDAPARELIARAGRAPASAPAPPAGDASRQTIVVCAFGALIKEPLLTEHELLNIHPSLLPRWRGAAPIERAIMAGDSETGVSIMRLTTGLDSGPVGIAESEPIDPQDTYGSLAGRLQRLAGDLVIRALDLKAAGRLRFSEQDETKATYAEKIGAEDRLLDPAHPAVELERRVRALQPNIGARVALPDGTLLGVHEAAVLHADSPSDDRAVSANATGRALGVHVVDGQLLLVSQSGVLELLVVQPQGGRAMPASAYLHGRGATLRRSAS
jgi:methionyl-tRNA formyltransferase